MAKSLIWPQKNENFSHKHFYKSNAYRLRVTVTVTVPK